MTTGMDWSAVSGMINAIGQQEVQQKQRAYYDEQRQELQKQSQQADAVRQSYDQLAKAFQDSGGDMDALAPLVKDAASMQAMSAFVKAYADSEEGVSRAKAATAKRIDESFRIASGHVPKALQSQVGSPEWVSAAQNVAAQGAFGGKLGDYDPQTQTFSVIQPNTVSGWSESDRVSATEVQQALQNFQKGIIQGPRGQMAKEWANAFIRYDITRRAANAEALTDTSKHILLSDGKKTLTVVPQLHESPGGGFVYIVQDPEKGLTIASDLEDYLRKGYKITTREIMQGDEKHRAGLALTGAQTQQSRMGAQANQVALEANRLKLTQAQQGVSTDPNQQVVLTNGDQTAMATPVYEDGKVTYSVRDSKGNVSKMANLNALINEGWTPATQANHQAQQASTNGLGIKDQSVVVSRSIDDINKEIARVLSSYSDGNVAIPAGTPISDVVLMLGKTGLPVLRAQAGSGDQQAIAHLEYLQVLDKRARELNDAMASFGYGAIGMNAPSYPADNPYNRPSVLATQENVPFPGVNPKTGEAGWYVNQGGATKYLGPYNATQQGQANATVPAR